MNDNTTITVRKGAVWPVYAEVSAGENDSADDRADDRDADGVTAEIDSGALFTLYREDGTVEAGFSALPVTGYERGPQRSLRVWYLLDTSTLDPGGYSALFSFHAAGSDGLDRGYEVDVQITILAPVEVEATYDPAQLTTSPLYQARLYAGDTDVSAAIWCDAELNFHLYAAGNVPQLAAANALETLALDRAKLANAVRVGSFGNGEAEAYKAIAERAKHLRSIAPVLPVVRSPDPIFVPASDHGRSPGNMSGW